MKSKSMALKYNVTKMFTTRFGIPNSVCRHMISPACLSNMQKAFATFTGEPSCAA